MIESITSTANNPKREKSFWIEYAAALWALNFAALHIVWAMGWYVGLDEGMAREAFARGWFLAYDLIAAGLCFLAVAVALAPVQSWGRKIPRALLNVVAWTCAVILILRGGAGAINAIYLAVVGNSLAPIFSFWDWWFCLGAGLFAASVWRFTRGAVRFPATNG